MNPRLYKITIITPLGKRKVLTAEETEKIELSGLLERIDKGSIKAFRVDDATPKD